ncbi:MNIO family bufferin maturase [Aliamphritea ceti]|uniref:MNIO family bufferin maturase n=1 Tax=Aliamphritea ceti TaxID=1524258 RepID=UPI0021C3BE0B|nr:DUF692 domain-containing protein [Aliamphritea ceti]
MQTNETAFVGVGLRQAHYQAVIDQAPSLGWFEVHSENYFNPGGPNHYFLQCVRDHYPLSLHGVGMSVGSTDPLDMNYLASLKQLIDRYEPFLVSDHISWSRHNGEYFPDLYPLPFTADVIQHLVSRIQQVQEYLGRKLILENVSSYVTFAESEMSEWDFLNEVTARSGCQLLLDVNNVAVNSCNHGFAATDFIAGISPCSVAEIHLSGAAHKIINQQPFIIDSHDAEVADSVWSLYQQAIERFGVVPSLIEWDSQMPDLQVLVDQAAIASEILGECVHAG